MDLPAAFMTLIQPMFPSWHQSNTMNVLLPATMDMHKDYHITMVTQLMDDIDTKEK